MTPKQLQAKLASFITRTDRMGTNPSDTGECLGLVNVWIRDYIGVPDYPLRGATFAKDLTPSGVKNLKPEVFEWVQNDPYNYSQIPADGDIIVFGAGFPLDNRGHVTVSKGTDKSWIRGFEQYQGVSPAIKQRSWNHDVKGWWHIKTKDEAPDPSIELKKRIAELESLLLAKESQLKAAGETIGTLTTQMEKQGNEIGDLNNKVIAKQKEVDDLSDDKSELSELLTKANDSISVLTDVNNSLRAELAKAGALIPSGWAGWLIKLIIRFSRKETI